MSADTASMPPWKLALIERKRRQEEEELLRMKEETSRMAEIPTWKRDLLSKKKHQDNSLVFLADGDHSRNKHDDVDFAFSQQRTAKQNVNDKSRVDGDPAMLTEVSSKTGGQEHQRMSQSQSDDKAVVDEPLIPIEQNPWYKSDHIKKRHSTRSDENKNRIELVENDHAHTEHTGSNASYKRSVSDDNVFTDNNIEINEYIGDHDSDNEEIYQPGFVNKLLNKFLHMASPKDDVKVIPKSPVEQVPNRSHSLENLLDEKPYHPLSPREREHRKTETLGKAVSMENLYSKQKTNSRTSGSSITSPLSPINPPSLSLARDDIIIVEAPHHPERERLSSSEGPNKQSEKGGKDLRNLVRDSAPTELPRPNFVSSTRTLFESSTDTLQLKKRKAPPAPKQENVPLKPTQPVQPIRQSSVDSLISEDKTTRTVHNNRHSETKKVSNTSKDKSLQSNKSTNLPNGMDAMPNVKPVRNAPHGNGKFDNTIQKVKKAGKSWSYGPSDSEKSGNEGQDPEVVPMRNNRDPEITKGNLSNVNSKTHIVNTTKDNIPNQSLHQKTETVNNSEKSNSNSMSNHTNKENHNLINSSTKTNDSVQVSNNSSGIKKRQAPRPPAVSVSADELQAKASNISKSWSTRNAELELEQQREKNTLKEQNKTTVIQNEQPEVQLKSELKTQISTPPPPTTNTAPKVTVKKPQQQKKSKKKSGPGSFLIRPASNLVVAPNRYDSYTVTKPDSDIPVTNIDDIPDDVPFTNIDDVEDEPLSPTGTDANSSCPPEVTKLDLSFTNECSETDDYSPKPVEIPPCRIVFEGAGVQTGKSSLSKSSNKKLKLTFNDDATSTYEYPSEQWLLEQFPPEPEVNGVPEGAPNGELDAAENESSSSLLSNPALGSTGGLSSYKSKVQVDFEFGSDTHKDKTAAPTRPELVSDPDDMQIKPADEADTSAWSDSATSDMLF